MLGGWWLSLRPSSDLSASALFVREQIECTGRAWRQTRHIQRVLKINMLRKIYSIYWNLIKEIWWTSGIVVHIIVVHTYSFMSFILRDASFYSHELIWPLYTLLVQIFELVSWEMENHDLLTCWLAPQVKTCQGCLKKVAIIFTKLYMICMDAYDLWLVTLSRYIEAWFSMTCRHVPW